MRGSTMAAPDDQPVLLTEGSFGQEDAGKDSGNQEVSSSSTGEALEPQQDGGASGEICDQLPASPATDGDNVRPSTAPESGLSSSLKEVERSVMKAVSDCQNNVPGSAHDGEEEGGDFNEASQQDILSDRLDQLPSDIGYDVEYMAPIEDPYMRAVHYMEKHKVMQIFQKLTAEIVYHRPPDPLEHMLSELHKMKKDRDAKVEAVISAASNH